jgi:hypothetical protein
MALLGEAMGISEERNNELCNLLVDLVDKYPTIDETLGDLIKRDDLTDIERAYIIFLYGDANANAKARRPGRS